MFKTRRAVSMLRCSVSSSPSPPYTLMKLFSANAQYIHGVSIRLHGRLHGRLHLPTKYSICYERTLVSPQHCRSPTVLLQDRQKQNFAVGVHSFKPFDLQRTCLGGTGLYLSHKTIRYKHVDEHVDDIGT